MNQTLTAELAELADAAVDAVLPTLIAPEVRTNLATDTKSSATDIVTAMDRWAEETIVGVILDARPNDGLLGEEGSYRPATSGITWVIDPIDGTVNFVRDLPGFSVSIAARVDGIETVGTVHDLVRGERFRAIRGGGATINGRPIKVSNGTDLARSLIATGFSYDGIRRREQATALEHLLPAVGDIRRFGGVALDLCSVACGRVDGCFERGINEWDVAAGGLIVREAGGHTEDRLADEGAYIAVAPGIQTAFLELLGRVNAHGF